MGIPLEMAEQRAKPVSRFMHENMDRRRSIAVTRGKNCKNQQKGCYMSVKPSKMYLVLTFMYLYVEGPSSLEEKQNCR